MLLAFGFLTPLLLWGTLLAAVPLVIHLLYRRRYRETPWAAMQFLIMATKAQSRWSWVDQWLLLLVRMLIPTLAALAMAGPLLDLATGGLQPSQPIHRALIVDVSLSTRAMSEGRAQATRIREAALELTRQSRPGDSWQLFLVGGVVPQAVLGEPTFLVEAVVEELQRLQPSAESGSILPGLQMVRDSLEGVRQREIEVQLLTDGQKSQWQPDSTIDREAIQSTLKQLAERAQLSWVDVTARPLGNIAITNLSLDRRYLPAGQPIRATATLTRYGSIPWPPRLEWKIDRRVVAVHPLDPAAESQQVVQLLHTPLTAGELRIEAGIGEDDLAADNRRGVIAEIRDRIPILLVDGRPSQTRFQNATDFLRLAMAPPQSQGPSSALAPEVIADGQLLSMDLSTYPLVWLCDVPQLTDREATVLARYVSRGGALVISLGPSVRAETYNQALMVTQPPLLPAELGPLVGDPQKRETSFGFLPDDFRHPLLAPFRGNPNSGFELTQTFAYQQARPAPEAKVVLRFDTQDPAFIERRVGRGRVLLMTTAADRTWGTWAVWGHAFVPMVQETIGYLLSEQLQSREILVGHPLVAAMPTGTALRGVQIRRPEEDRTESALTTDPENSLVTYDAPREPGFYALETPGTPAVASWFAVNADVAESDLMPVAPADMQSAWAGTSPLEREIATSDASPAPAQNSTWEATPLARQLLMIMLALIIIEPWLAWNRKGATLVLVFLVAGAALVGLWGPWPRPLWLLLGVASLLALAFGLLRRRGPATLP